MKCWYGQGYRMGKGWGWRVILAVGLWISITGCQKTAVPPTPEALQPLSEAQCQELSTAVSQSLGAPARVAATVPFEDMIGEQKGNACLIASQGPGTQFASVADVLGKIRTVFEGQSWEEDSRYAADGPLGSATAFRKESAMAVVSVHWEAIGEESGCELDKPVAECDVPADQKLYQIEINIVANAAP